jgi:L-amino acid N-acyltransferase YncA
VNPAVRHAAFDDLPAIVDIYNQSIPGGWSTADTAPVSVESRVEWFRKFEPARRPIWVAEIDGSIAGWVSLSSFYAGRPAYDATAEISTYIGVAYHKRGLGRFLKRYAIARCPDLGITTVLSMYFDHNAATKKLNDELGFTVMGHLPEIATVRGEKRGLVIAGLRVLPPVQSA